MAKFIKFRDAASVTAAKASKNAGQLDIVKSENTLVYEGEAVIRGISDAQKDYVDRMVKAENDAKAKISFSVSPNSTFVKGTATTFTLTLTCTFDGKNIAADGETAKIYVDGGEVEVKSSATGIYTATVSKSATTTFKASATVKGVERETENVVVQAFNQVLYGASDNEKVPTNTDQLSVFIKGLTAKSVSSSATATYNFTKAGYCYILVPNDVSIGSLPSGFDSSGNALTTVFTQLDNLVYNGITYRVYVTGEKQTSALTVRIK